MLNYICFTTRKIESINMEKEIYLEILGLVVAAILGIGGIIVFVIKGVIGNKITKDLERFKIQFSKLHQDQAVAIRELFELIVDMEEDVNNLYYKYMPIGLNPPTVDEIEVINRMCKLDSLYRKSRIYLDQKTNQAVGDLCSHLSTGISYLEQRKMLMDSDPEGQSTQNENVEMEAFQEIKENVPKAKEVLEQEFKRLLGNV
jgi:hypothetical protein